MVQEQPEFPGGMPALMDYFRKQVRYPKQARKKRIQGKVYVEFVVTKEGTIEDANVLRGVHPLLDAEALRAVAGMPRWFPGRSNGEPVRVRYTIPITFRLEQ